MRRRSVLAAFPAVLAGCIDGVVGPRGIDATGVAAEDAGSATTTRRPPSADAEARACDGTAVLLSRSGRVLRPGGDGEVETIAFALRNRSDDPVAVRPDAWTIYRRACGSWTAVESGGDSAERRTLPPGGSHRWSLSLTPHPTPRDPATSHVVADLPTGLYAFEVAAQVDGERVTCAVRFAVEAT